MIIVKFTAILLLIYLSCFPGQFINQKVKKWIGVQTSTVSPSNPVMIDNSPWFANFNYAPTCMGVVSSASSVSIDGSNRLILSTDLSGGSGTSACFSLNYTDGVQKLVVIQLSYSDIVYEFDFKWHCGAFQIIEQFPIDKNKPDIENGISCHCPGGISNPQFTPCQSEVINTTGQFLFQGGLPYSQTPPVTTLCHNIATRGQATGCELASNDETDYFLKFKSNWQFLPAFKMKPRDYPEVVVTVFVDGQPINNVSISALDPQTIELGFDTMTIDSVSVEAPVTTIPDFVIMSSNGNFSDPKTIYMIREENFNWFGDFNPLKFCPIKYEQTTGLEMRKWEIDNVIKEAFLPSQCRPAKGVIQAPFPRIYDAFTASNSILNRIDINSFALFPGETTLMKVNSQVNLNLKVAFYGNPILTNTLVDFSVLNSFSFTCLPSLNQDGFHCTNNINVQFKSQVTIKSVDAQYIITTHNVVAGTNSFNFIVNPMYVSNNSLTLCASITWQSPVICATQGLKYDIKPDIYQPNTTDPDSSNGNNNGGSNIFQDAEGKLHGWVVAVITVASVIAFLIILWIAWPLILILGKGMVVILKKLKKMSKKAATDIETAHKESSEPELKEEQLNDQEKMSVLKNLFN